MADFHGKKVKIFTLSSNPELAQEIADYVGIELSECSLGRFSDGEVSMNITETVRGHHVFIVQPTSAPVNENYMELLIMIDALKRASAKTINVIMPYYGYCRQDRKALSRQPISAKLIADLLTVAGATRVLAMDLHAAQIQGFFNIPIDNFEASSLLVNYFKEKKLNDVVVVSPDHGGTTRARKFALNFDAPIAIIDKRRPRPNVAEVMNIIGDVEGKSAIIVDDIVDTAGTVIAAAHALKERGAKNIYVCCSHGVLSGDAPQRIFNSDITEFITTNSIKIPQEKMNGKIKQLSVAPILGQGLINILDETSINGLFTYKPSK